MTDENQIDGTTHAEKDANGDIVHNPDVVNTPDLNIGGSDLYDSGDFVSAGPTFVVNQSRQFSTTSTTYTQSFDHLAIRIQWGKWAPSNAQTALITTGIISNSVGDVRLQNLTDGETVHEQLDVGNGTRVSIGPTNYTPTTTGSVIDIAIQIRTNDGATQTTSDTPNVQMGVQL